MVSVTSKNVSTSTILNLVHLPLLTILSIVSVCQFVHFYMSPGIEPGNLIRTTLIRSPPGASFLLNLVIKLHE